MKKIAVSKKIYIIIPIILIIFLSLSYFIFFNTKSPNDKYIKNVLVEKYDSEFKEVKNININSKKINGKTVKVSADIFLKENIIEKISISLFKQKYKWATASFEVIETINIPETPVTEDTLLEDFKTNIGDTNILLTKENDFFVFGSDSTQYNAKYDSTRNENTIPIYDTLIAEIISDSGIVEYNKQNVQVAFIQNTSIFKETFTYDMSYSFDSTGWNLTTIKFISSDVVANELSDEIIKSEFLNSNHFSNSNIYRLANVDIDSVNIVSKEIIKSSPGSVYPYLFLTKINYISHNESYGYDSSETYSYYVYPYFDGKSLRFEFANTSEDEKIINASVPEYDEPLIQQIQNELASQKIGFLDLIIKNKTLEKIDDKFILKVNVDSTFNSNSNTTPSTDDIHESYLVEFYFDLNAESVESLWVLSNLTQTFKKTFN